MCFFLGPDLMNEDARVVPVTLRVNYRPMAKIRTMRVPRTWRDKLVLWKRAFETKIFDSRREVRGRGPTAEASREAALTKWTELETSEQNEGEEP